MRINVYSQISLKKSALLKAIIIIICSCYLIHLFDATVTMDDFVSSGWLLSMILENFQGILACFGILTVAYIIRQSEWRKCIKSCHNCKENCLSEWKKHRKLMLRGGVYGPCAIKPIYKNDRIAGGSPIQSWSIRFRTDHQNWQLIDDSEQTTRLCDHYKLFCNAR